MKKRTFWEETVSINTVNVPSEVEMPRAHIFMTRIDPYPSQQTRTPHNFWTALSLARKEGSVCFAS